MTNDETLEEMMQQMDRDLAETIQHPDPATVEAVDGNTLLQFDPTGVPDTVEEIEQLEIENKQLTDSGINVEVESTSTSTVWSVAAPPTRPPDPTSKCETWTLDKVAAEQPK